MRTFLSAVTFFSALYMPIWIFMLLALGLSVRYRAWEVICVAFIIDCLYLPIGGIFGLPFLTTLIAATFVWGLEPLRNRFVFR